MSEMTDAHSVQAVIVRNKTGQQRNMEEQNVITRPESSSYHIHLSLGSPFMDSNGSNVVWRMKRNMKDLGEEIVTDF